MATPLPYDTIRLLAVPPASGSELQDYRSWLRQLVQHEYTHILHLDRIGGIPAVVNRVFGKLWPPNGLTPSFMIEGLAVLNESEGDPASGRNASAQFDMEARALALDGPFPRLDEVSNPFLRWPLGDVPYLLGGRFMGFLQARYGPDAIAGFIAEQGATVWPYAPSWAGRRWFGGNGFPELWAEYVEAERAYAEGRRAWIRERPVTRPTPLTRRGGELLHPRFSPDGTFVAYRERGLDEAPGLRRVALDGRDLGRVTVVDANGALALASPHEAVVAIGEVFHEFRVYDDLYRVNLDSGDRRRITRGERATDPDVAADGTRRLRAADRRRDHGARAAPARRGAGGALRAPRRGGLPSPHRARRPGRVRAARGRPARHRRVARRSRRARHGRRRARHGPGVDPRRPLRPVRVGSRRRPQPPRLGGRQRAGPPGDERRARRAGARRLSRRPHDRLPLLLPRRLRPRDHPASTRRPGSSRSRRRPSRRSRPLRPPPRRPSPIPSRRARTRPGPRVGPTFWLPLVSSDAAGPVYGAITAGTDVLARHAWALQGWWSADAREPGYALAYLGGWSWPSLDLSSRLDARHLARPPVPAAADVGVRERGRDVHVDAARARARAAGRLERHGLRVDRGRAAIPARLEPYRFRDGLLSEVTLQARYTDARRFVRSISPEEGRTVTLIAAARARPRSGATSALSRARATVTQYLRVPSRATSSSRSAPPEGSPTARSAVASPFELGGFSDPDLARAAAGRHLLAVDAAPRIPERRARRDGVRARERRAALPARGARARPLDVAALPASGCTARCSSTWATRSISLGR